MQGSVGSWFLGLLAGQGGGFFIFLKYVLGFSTIIHHTTIDPITNIIIIKIIKEWILEEAILMGSVGILSRLEGVGILGGVEILGGVRIVGE